MFVTIIKIFIVNINTYGKLCVCFGKSDLCCNGSYYGLKVSVISLLLPTFLHESTSSLHLPRAIDEYRIILRKIVNDYLMTFICCEDKFCCVGIFRCFFIQCVRLGCIRLI